MDEPPEKNDPEHRGEEELNDCHQQPALNQLPETRDKETAQSRDDVAGGTLTCHKNSFSGEAGGATGKKEKCAREDSNFKPSAPASSLPANLPVGRHAHKGSGLSAQRGQQRFIALLCLLGMLWNTFALLPAFAVLLGQLDPDHDVF